MFTELIEAMEEQENKDFRHLSRLYDRFLKLEESGNNSEAKKLYEQIKELEIEMGLREAES